MPVDNVILVPDVGFPRAWECACHSVQRTFDVTGGLPHLLTIGVDGMSAIMQLSWDDDDERTQTIRDVLSMLGGKCLWYIFSAEAYYLTLNDAELQECNGHLPSPTLDPDSIECLIIVGHSADGESRSIRWDIARDGDKATLIDRHPSSDIEVWRDLWSGLLVSIPKEVA
jgi:hypothetical protein